jgi:hypothetical protein
MLAKAPNRKRAEQYLAASGAVPISVSERGTISSNAAWPEMKEARSWKSGASPCDRSIDSQPSGANATQRSDRPHTGIAFWR